MLTAAVRDLHRSYPGNFLTDVRTSCPPLWENNPHITPLEEDDPEVEIIECHYPLIHQSNQRPYHFLHGFIHFLNEQLFLDIKPTEFRGDIYLSKEEQVAPSPVEEIVGKNLPYWIIISGGKQDYTIKWWDQNRYQEVVNHFHGRIQFVQVGGAGHFHPELEGVIDLRGKLDMRQLLRLVYHSDGVVCPVTFLMHLAAAVDTHKELGLRPCVVVAGGREPAHWEAYPGHQFIHTIGMLPCCKTGGCWKSRTMPLRDGSKHDRAENLCLNVVNNLPPLPKCMDMIPASEVISRIETYLTGKIAFKAFLENEAFSDRLGTVQKPGRNGETLNEANARSAAEKFIHKIPLYPGTFSDRGIVICGGGVKYYTNAWIAIKMLRYFGCTLPIQLWYLGENEIDDQMKSWMEPLGVECVDGLEIRKQHPVRILNGWELKPYAIIHSPFEEVLFLDADNMPVVNPESLFDTWQYQETGAVFWPDFGRLAPNRTVWRLCGVSYQDEPEFETGQILINKQKCWNALCLTMWYNEHSDFFYHHIHGDKETFHMAFRKLNQPYSMPGAPIHQLAGTMCQHDFGGRRVFQHRNLAKWDLFEKNRKVEGFLYEHECRQALEELRQKWATNRRSLRSMVSEEVDEADAFRWNGESQKVVLPRKKAVVCDKSFVIRARFDGYTGYGLHSQSLVKDLKRFGHEFGILPIPGDQRSEVPVSRSIAKLFATESKNCSWELLLYPPVIPPNPRVSTVYFTMWETTQLSAKSFKYLQKADAVIVPCEWNATCFSAQGLKCPIFICPLGINTKVFRFQARNESKTFVFGAAGNLSISGRTRKGIETVIAAFKAAFPRELNVRLRIKAMPEDMFPDLHDNRIEIVNRCLTQAQLAEWYAGLTCFVSASKSEAWGLMQLQAMAVGRPVIACSFGGLREFFNDEVGYCVDYELREADERYEGLGLWAIPSVKSMAEQMRRAYEDRKELDDKSKKASQKALQYTWLRSNQRLENILEQLGAINGKAALKAPGKRERSKIGLTTK